MLRFAYIGAATLPPLLCAVLLSPHKNVVWSVPEAVPQERDHHEGTVVPEGEGGDVSGAENAVRTSRPRLALTTLHQPLTTALAIPPKPVGEVVVGGVARTVLNGWTVARTLAQIGVDECKSFNLSVLCSYGVRNLRVAEKWLCTVIESWEGVRRFGLVAVAMELREYRADDVE